MSSIAVPIVIHLKEVHVTEPKKAEKIGNAVATQSLLRISLNRM
jgi:hypothetical protein